MFSVQDITLSDLVSSWISKNNLAYPVTPEGHSAIKYQISALEDSIIQYNKSLKNSKRRI